MYLNMTAMNINMKKQKQLKTNMRTKTKYLGKKKSDKN